MAKVWRRALRNLQQRQKEFDILSQSRAASRTRPGSMNAKKQGSPRKRH